MEHDITDVLTALRTGRREVMDRLFSLVYDELRRIAHRTIGPGRAGDTLGTTALVHETYLKLVDQTRADWRDRAHFCAVAAMAMRQILVDHARARAALKKLSRLDNRLARVVECRFFGGLSEDETAEVLGVTPRTVRRDWVKAKGLLSEELGA
jgi:hypothetical protein